MNKRKIGKKLEDYVVERIREILHDSLIRPTKNSGASSELGDIRCDKFIIECKKRNTKDVVLKEDVWTKLINEMPLGSTRVPVYILENKNKKRFAVLNLEDFFNLIKQ